MVNTLVFLREMLKREVREGNRDHLIHLVPDPRGERRSIVEEITSGIMRHREKEPSLLAKEVRQFWKGVELMSSFSHSNPNLPSRHVWGNAVLCDVAARLSLDHTKVLNIAHDFRTPGHHAEQGHQIRYFQGKIPVLERPDVPYAFQESLLQIERVRTGECSDYNARLESLVAIHNSNCNGTLPRTSAERIVACRNVFLREVLGMEIIPETITSSLRENIAGTLELLDEKGKPFYNLDLPRSRETWLAPGTKNICWVKYVDTEATSSEKGLPAKVHIPLFERDGFFTSECGKYRIPTREIYQKLRTGNLVPMVQTLVLATVVAPQIPHIGGGSFKNYAPDLVRDLAEQLQLPFEGLVHTTKGIDPCVYRSGNKGLLSSIYVHYPLLGKEFVRELIGL